MCVRTPLIFEIYSSRTENMCVLQNQYFRLVIMYLILVQKAKQFIMKKSWKRN